MIEHDVITRIVEAAHIVEVVEDFVTLKRKGANYVGNCPFHHERTPSFMVSPAKNIYKCFGCGKGGDAVHFVMEHEQLNYPEALKYLAKKYGIEIVEKEQTPEERRLIDRRESLMVVSAYAARMFQENLHETREGKAIGMSYFKERGLREDLVKKFELGYSLAARDAFTKKALNDGYKEEFLVETGLCIKGEQALFDRFSGRVMFPIHSLSGKVIAYSGRTLKTDKNIAKYVNSPESEIYRKSDVLYGIFQAKNSIVRHRKCFLVEGNIDVIAMHQAGIDNTVATCGTALTDEQVRMIKRFTDNVTVMYDGDAAGMKASLRAIDMFLKAGMDVKALLLPDGDDPDSFARKHSATELEAYFSNNETNFIRFRFQMEEDRIKNDPVQKAALINAILASIALIPDPVRRMAYLQEIAAISGMEEKALAGNVAKLVTARSEKERLGLRQKTYREDAAPQESPQQPATPPATAERQDDKYSMDSAEQEIIRLLISYGNEKLTADENDADGMSVASYLIREIRSDELEPQQPLLKAIFREYEQRWESEGQVNDHDFARHPDPEISRLVAGMIMPRYELSKLYDEAGIVIEDQNLPVVVPQTLMAYKQKKVLLMLKELSPKMQQAVDNGDSEHYDALYARFTALTEVKKKLAKILGKRTL
jgi:DNA primase